MLIFLQGRNEETRKSYVKSLATYLEEVTGAESLIFEKSETGIRQVISVIGQYSSNLTAEEMGDPPAIIFSSDDEWFLLEGSDIDLLTEYETLGGIMLSDPDSSSYDLGSVKSREKLRSFHVAEYPEAVLENVYRTATYARGRARLMRDMSGGAYRGEVMASPKAIFVSGGVTNSEDFWADADHMEEMKKYLLPTLAHHCAVVSIDSAHNFLDEDIFPYAVYIGIGSTAYGAIGGVEDNVIAGIPEFKGIKSEMTDKLYKAFADVTHSVIESGERKTSLLALKVR